MANVPNVPGVPPLSGYVGNSFQLLTGDLISAILTASPVWGIFLDGFPVLPARSTVTFEYKREWVIADYPVEQGAFQSYDKVQTPFDVKVRVASGPLEIDRQDLLTALDAIGNSPDLYDVVTPERIYSSVNVHHIGLRRASQNGVGLIVADVWLMEVRVSAASQFANTQQPANAGQQSNGNVQAQTPTDAQGGSASNALKLTVHPTDAN